MAKLEVLPIDTLNLPIINCQLPSIEITKMSQERSHLESCHHLQQTIQWRLVEFISLNPNVALYKGKTWRQSVLLHAGTYLKLSLYKGKQDIVNVLAYFASYWHIPRAPGGAYWARVSIRSTIWFEALISHMFSSMVSVPSLFSFAILLSMFVWYLFS